MESKDEFFNPGKMYDCFACKLSWLFIGMVPAIVACSASPFGNLTDGPLQIDHKFFRTCLSDGLKQWWLAPVSAFVVTHDVVKVGWAMAVFE